MFRLPYWFGYRLTLLDSGQLLLIGRNFVVPVMALSDVYMMGRKEASITYSALRRIRFATRFPRRSVFKFTSIQVEMKSDAVIHLVPNDSPMYSWQGRKTYHAIRSFLAARGLVHILGVEPDFSYS